MTRKELDAIRAKNTQRLERLKDDAPMGLADSLETIDRLLDHIDELRDDLHRSRSYREPLS